MKLKTVNYEVYSGGSLVVTLNKKTAEKLDLFPGDRVKVSTDEDHVVAVSDVSKTLDGEEIGVLAEVGERLNLDEGELVSVEPEETPESVRYIKKKLDDEKLNKEEMFSIVNGIVDNLITEAEIAYFVSAAYTNGFSLKETEKLVKAMALSGEVLRWKDKVVVDKHCIGGVPGNRTTPIIVPVLAAAGAHIPKTSSRAITSPSGTADTMEVLTNVKIEDTEEIKRIVKKTGGCMVWGGAINMAPADDKIIKIEKPLALDPTPMLLSSIMAKKYAVGAKHVLIDIPVGPFSKVVDSRRSHKLRRNFEEIGDRLGMEVEVMRTYSDQPIGRGIGPALEARDVMWVLENDERGPLDLREKSLNLSAKLVESAGLAEKGEGKKMAEVILSSGQALKKMRQIIKEQGGNPKISSDDIKLGDYTYEFDAKRSGKVHMINDDSLSISRLAGAPRDKKAGIYLHCKLGDEVEEGDKLFTIYAECQRKLDEAVEYAINNFPITIK